ncbi:MATE family efflux transporter [Inconstantimicrobium porci]|uniref:Multidrug export protein MepA n=1 Tax=Inconstantimicrobium porci TaxID=2652291 RepID=A0A7X2T1C6_9CLOT|nr:MATE family efflux transporter [Inconstantimicrobium porci]MSR91531.1 MATE family efflux transporter [Inconstantimicrobium porci]
MASTKYEEKLSTDNMIKLVFKMAIPSVAAQVVNLLYSIVDRIYIGHIPNIGTNALAGVGVTNSIIILIAAFAQIVGGGGGPLATIALGKGDRKRAEKILGNGFFLLIFFAISASVVTYIFMNPILMTVGASSNTITYAVDYLSTYLLGTIFVMMAMGLNTYISAQGRPGIAMLSVIIGAVVNIILDPIFIYVFELGVKGAAIATIISQCLSALWVLKFLFSQKASLQIKMCYIKPDFRIIGSMVSLGIAPFIMASTESLIGFVMNGTLSKYGDIYVSALTVMQSAMQIISVPIGGFSQGFIPIVSYNYGHKNMDRVKQCFKITAVVMVSFNFIGTLLIIIFPKVVAAIFTKDVLLINKVSEMMMIFLAGMTIFGLQRECQSMFLALGQAKISLFIALLRKVFLLVPLVLILSRFIGVKGVFAAEAVADATAAILCTIIFRIKFPKILKANK